MVEKVPGNFKNKFKFNEIGLNCTNCMVEMTQNHLAICPERANLRQGLDMNKLDDIVIYFRRYLTDIKKKESRAGSCGGSAGLLDDYL